jgi:hypothetical protein
LDAAAIGPRGATEAALKGVLTMSRGVQSGYGDLDEAGDIMDEREVWAKMRIVLEEIFSIRSPVWISRQIAQQYGKVDPIAGLAMLSDELSRREGHLRLTLEDRFALQQSLYG